MGCSRKHYQETAEALKWALNGYPNTPIRRQVRRETVESIAEDLSRMFKRDNGAFNRSQFMNAIFEEEKQES